MGIVDWLVFGVALAASDATSSPSHVWAIEWLPMGVHSAVLREYEKAGGVEIRRYNAMGDEQELLTALRDAARTPKTVVIAFGPLVSEKAGETCPGARRIVLFASGSGGHNAIVMNCDPAPRAILEAGLKLRPALKRLGIIYTSEFGPNVALATRLGEEARGQGVDLVAATVPHGLCRTDSDFEKALGYLKAGGGCDVLYLPDDPNVSRFSGVIHAFTKANDMATLGTDATRGKGCAAAFVRDCEGIGRNLAAVVQAVLESREPDPPLLHVAPKLVIEEAE